MSLSIHQSHHRPHDHLRNSHMSREKSDAAGYTFTLTSQQKDLLIIHLKGEVYELR